MTRSKFPTRARAVAPRGGAWLVLALAGGAALWMAALLVASGISPGPRPGTVARPAGLALSGVASSGWLSLAQVMTPTDTVEPSPTPTEPSPTPTELTPTYTPSPQLDPDLFIETYEGGDVDVSRRTLTLKVLVYNGGEGESGPFDVQAAGPSGWVPAYGSGPSLAAGQGATIDIVLRIPDDAWGTNPGFYVQVDPDGKVPESDEKNNDYGIEAVDIPSLPDLVVRGAEVIDVDATRQTVRLGVTVYNAGGMSSPAFVVLADEQKLAPPSATATASSLAANESTHVNIEAYYGDASCGTTGWFVIVLDPGDDILEQDEKNNETTVEVLDLPCKPFWTFGTWVYETTEAPIANVQVRLACSTDPASVGEELSSALTDADGRAAIETDVACGWYNLHVVPPKGYAPRSADSYWGTAVDKTWLQGSGPWEGHSLESYFMLERLPPYVDLSIQSAKIARFESNGAVAVLEVVVTNVGTESSVSTTVEAAEKSAAKTLAGTQAASTTSQSLTAIEPGESAVVQIRIAIPAEWRGTQRTFTVNADAAGLLQEEIRDNNTADVGPVTIPRQATPVPSTRVPPVIITRPPKVVTRVVTLTPEPPTATPAPTDTPMPTLLPPIVTTQAPTVVAVLVPVYPASRSAARQVGFPTWLAPTLVVLVAIGVIGGAALVLRPHPPASGNGSEPPSEPAPAGLPLPPLRLMRLWLTEGAGSGGRMVADGETLAAGSLYTLNVQVQPRNVEKQDVRSHDPTVPGVPLDLAVMSPDPDVHLSQQAASLNVPPQGPSSPARVEVRPTTPGSLRVRVGAFFHGRLVQSAVLAVGVTREGGPAHAGELGITGTVDYVANASLVGAETLPHPAMTIVSDPVPAAAGTLHDGSHWIGTFLSAGAEGWQMRTGDVHAIDGSALSTWTGLLRRLMAEVVGVDRGYPFVSSIPLDDDGHLRLADPAVSRHLPEWERAICALAWRGWEVYQALFLLDDDAARAEALRHALDMPGIISVARVRAEDDGVPWASLYNLPLDTGKHDTFALCDVFKDQLAANEWAADGTLRVQHDLLDNPRACRAQGRCPLNGPSYETMVCPFGFWGFTHQVEQPLQQVTPTPVNQVPAELLGGEFDARSFVLHGPDAQLRVAMFAHPELDADLPPPDHRTEVAELAARCGLSFDYRDDRDEVRALLAAGGYHLLYFYCHGEDGADGIFRLKLGSRGTSALLGAADLDPVPNKWADPHPIVILNGCETLALLPNRIHLFLKTLRRMGAYGVVGTEIKVWNQLARPFGLHVLGRLVEGDSIGEAFLAARLHLLRHYNPSGLVYTYYAPATLHLHTGADCHWCREHAPTRLAARGKAWLELDSGLARSLDGRLVIGRTPGCDLRLDDRAAARQHAYIERRAADYVLTDMHSAAGTLVNGGRIEQHVLHDGDQIQVGNTVLTFRQG